MCRTMCNNGEDGTNMIVVRAYLSICALWMTSKVSQDYVLHKQKDLSPVPPFSLLKLLSFIALVQITCLCGVKAAVTRQALQTPNFKDNKVEKGSKAYRKQMYFSLLRSGSCVSDLFRELSTQMYMWWKCGSLPYVCWTPSTHTITPKWIGNTLFSVQDTLKTASELVQRCIIVLLLAIANYVFLLFFILKCLYLVCSG